MRRANGSSLCVRSLLCCLLLAELALLFGRSIVHLPFFPLSFFWLFSCRPRSRGLHTSFRSSGNRYQVRHYSVAAGINLSR